MPITPIEMISIPTKSQEASVIKSAENQRPTNDQLTFGAKFQEEIKHQSEQTVAAKKSDNPEYRYDAKEKGNNSFFGQQKKQKKKNKQENDTADKNGNEPHKGFDIRI